MRKKIIHVLFRDKPLQMLIALHEHEKLYASNLAKIVDCTYSHVVKVLKEFNKSGIVEFKKNGRIKHVALTKKGRDFVNSLKKSIELL